MKKCATLAISLILASGTLQASSKVVIAHRGASGYLPEHSLAAKSAAYFMGADYIEQDVVMTRDDQLVVLHDHYLDRVTNVAKQYPERFRMENGKKRWFAIDFDLTEIQGLKMTEGFTLTSNEFSKASTKAIFPERFPIWKSSFHVHTLAEEIELIQGLNHSTGRNIGIYPEIKAPWFHRHEGKDISTAVLKTLKQYGYTSQQDKVYLQCFDPNETRRIAKELMPAMGMHLKIVQLMAETSWNETMVYKGDQAAPYNYDWMFKPGAMEQIAQYADGIGPWKPFLVDNASTKKNIVVTPMIKAAKQAGLEVHPYTFRADQGRIPTYADGFEDMLDIFLNRVGVDGVFTDFPDRAVQFIQRSGSEKNRS
ncbi:glycerophosphodiester phosphodiesterase [Endozoicomonas gorgoniicola]|uniref:glycerophosphodiester phosphodiesterase n=1 Tax=Endozoicomonas gorgoniicola TaxID=1234144 RepID=A0ABT3MYF9_9GAMM|nr:glycerophosphodiester phosphodiesterase [Endozoicomonas gorgoniicola]MCW7554415.1 glycerophosphodiester phosphodiesterase [Endozoicomonas gorgoniicola]